MLKFNPPINPEPLFGHSPRPIRAEWERAINALRPFLSAEKFKEAEETHWRMFDRANSWFELGGRARRDDLHKDNLRKVDFRK